MEDTENSAALTGSQDAEQPEKDENARFYGLIAQRVRDDSSARGRLSSHETVAKLLAEPEKIEACLRAMADDEAFKDIQRITASNGSVYLYSETGIPRKAAGRLALDEEVRSQVASHVREDSAKLVKLTPVPALGILIPGAETDKIDSHLSILLDDERYRDIQLLTNSRGSRYLYSEKAMTRSYAGLLARTEANDPLATIAATVRDDSRIYPRPTRMDIFKEPIFRLNPNEIERYLQDLSNRPEYKDIKILNASTGAVYLYSDIYVNGDWAKATVEWEEVEQFENP